MDTQAAYMLVDDLAGLIEHTQPESIVSRTFYRGEQAKAVVFGFAAGQELSEHTASRAAILQIVQGEATVTLGDDRHDLRAGAWVFMPPELKHSVTARTPLIMLLLIMGE